MIYLNFKELSSSGRLLSDGESIYDGMRKLFFDTVDRASQKISPGHVRIRRIYRGAGGVFMGSFL